MEKELRYKETILRIKSDVDVAKKAEALIVKFRQELDAYITLQPEFQYSLAPIKLRKDAPTIAKLMEESAELFNVGPLAAVAGAVSELLVKESEKWGVRWIIAENGGDVCMRGDHSFTISIFAGKSPLSNRIGLHINPAELSDGSYGICTSSASVGHSISFGESDAVTVCAKSAAIADAAATAIGNEVKGRDETEAVNRGIDFAKKFLGIIDGAIVIKDRKIGTVGKLPKLIRLV